jgi:uncharacterized surface protein with fasciclin (FAS1) repeats
MRHAFTSLRALTFAFVIAALGINTAALAGGHSAPAAKPDIVDTAIAAGSFTTLVAAVQAAELVDALKGDGPLTVFAPNDEAFSKLWEGTVESLLEPENKEKLQALLLYHVVAGKVMSTDLSGTVDAETLQGDTIKIVVDGGVTVNKANVIAADIEAGNGVIHVIDAVLIPAE